MTLTSYKSSKPYQNLGQNLGLCGAIFTLIALFFLTACGASAALDDLSRQLAEFERNRPPADEESYRPPSSIKAAQDERQEKTDALVAAETRFNELLEAARIADDGNDVNAQTEAQKNLLAAAKALRLAREEREKAQINEEKVTAAAFEQERIDAAANELNDAAKAAAEALKNAKNDEEREEATQQAVVINRIQQFQTSSATADQPTTEQATPTVVEEVERAKSTWYDERRRQQAEASRQKRELDALRATGAVLYEVWARETANKYSLVFLDTAPSGRKQNTNQFLRNPYNGNGINYSPVGRSYQNIGLEGFDHVTKRHNVLNVEGANTTMVGGYSYFNGLWNADLGYWWDSPWTSAQRSYFATIHPDTNVGPAIPTHTPKAKWKVNFSAITSETWAKTNPNRDTIVNREFSMDMDFLLREFTATIPYTYYNIHSYKFVIRGRYDAQGFINGRIENRWNDTNSTPGDFGDGDLTGLIGERGLVAAFISDDRHDDFRGQHFGYSGGFVACPTVNPNGTGACKARQEQ